MLLTLLKNQPQFIKRLTLFAFISSLIIHHFYAYLGHFGYDDMEYGRVSANLLNGIFDAGNHYSFRLTLVALTACSYKLFGINDFASAIPALLATIGTLFLVYRILKDQNWAVLTFGLGIFTLNNWTFFYSDKLMPDPLVTFFAFLFFYIFYSYNYKTQKYPVIIYSFSAAFALFLCFNSKETVVLLVPLVAWLLITDLIFRRSGKFWIQFIGFNVLLLAIYLLLSQVLFGNAITRFNSIVSNSYLNSCSYDQQPFIETLKRITYGLAELFLSHDMLLGFFVVLSGLFFIPLQQLIQLKDRKSFFVLSSVILMLSSNFMSISVTSYIPMCADPRHYLFLIPVISVAAALILKDQFGSFKFKLRLFILILLAFCISLYLKSNKGFELYLPVLMVVFIFIFLKNTLIAQRLFTILFISALLIQPIQMVIYAQKIKYEEQKKIIQNELILKYPKAIVITDEVQKRLGNYYLGFSPNATCLFISYSEADTIHFRKDMKKILLNNWYTRYLSGMDEQDLPYFAVNAANSVFKDEKLKIEIFELNESEKKEKIFSSENNFEDNPANWSQSQSLSNDFSSSGIYSEKCNEFSVNLSVSLDSILSDSIRQIVFLPRLQILANYDPECNLVLAIDSAGKQYFWQGFNLSKYIKAKGNWWPVKFQLVLNKLDIHKNSTLKMYLWNNKKNEIYVDDFGLEIYSISN